MEKFASLKKHFLLNPEITFLNFGSFGACPKPIFETYQRFQLELEEEPVQFITVNGIKYLEESRNALSTYIHCAADEVVFMVNPSYAVNTVVKSLNLKKCDEILATNIEYGACDKAWDFWCSETGATYIRQPIQLPLTSKEQFIADFCAGITPNTKLIFISQITSTTGLILPVREICAIAREKGILTFVDGAHVPGHIPLDLEELNVDFYTGACHKWMMTAKGCSFLYAKKSVQQLLKPLVVSWGYKSLFPTDSEFLDHHQMTGTRDFSAFLTVHKAIEFMQKNNWEAVRKSCHEMVIQQAPRFFELLKSKPLAPLNDEFIGQMVSIPIRTAEPEKLQRHLFEKHKIEIPIMRQDSLVFIRFSIQVFNAEKDLDHLFDALVQIIEETDLIQSPNC